MLKSKKSLHHTLNAIQDFTNPFEVEANKLVSLASGADIEKDVLRAEEASEAEKKHSSRNAYRTKRKFFLPNSSVKTEDHG